MPINAEHGPRPHPLFAKLPAPTAPAPAESLNCSGLYSFAAQARARGGGTPAAGMTTAFGRHKRGAAMARAGPPSAGQHQGATEMRASASSCSWRAFTLKAAMVPPTRASPTASCRRCRRSRQGPVVHERKSAIPRDVEASAPVTNTRYGRNRHTTRGSGWPRIRSRRARYHNGGCMTKRWRRPELLQRPGQRLSP